MKVIGFFTLGLLYIHAASAFEGFLKPLPPPKPGALLDVLKKPKLPGVNIHLSKGGGGFGVGASIGSFGFGFGVGGHYVPPGTKVNVPPKVPDEESYLPDLKPGFPDFKPYPPEVTSGKERWEKDEPRPTWEEREKDEPRPGWEDDEKDDPTAGSYGDDEVEHPKRDDSYEDNKRPRPAWEDIGETDQEDPDSKSENFMNGDLIEGGLIQPRLKNRRNRRFIESHVYHVPLVFRSNAKPFQVKIQSNPNSLAKEGSEK